jgi:hypothetical protein
MKQGLLRFSKAMFAEGLTKIKPQEMVAFAQSADDNSPKKPIH